MLQLLLLILPVLLLLTAVEQPVASQEAEVLLGCVSCWGSVLTSSCLVLGVGSHVHTPAIVLRLGAVLQFSTQLQQ